MTTPIPGDLVGAVEAWIAADPDPDARAELEALLADGAAEDLADRFSGPLEFGTAGLRGALGAGPARMNVAVVRAAAAGLARFLLDERPGAPEAGVVVGYDARHRSQEFARDSAAVFAAAGVRAFLADRPWPTPVTAFAVRHVGAAAGVMVTASHNPAPDNGYKVYEATGGQITTPVDEEIAARIAAVGGANRVPLAPDSPLITTIGDGVFEAYLDEAVSVVPVDGATEITIAYTPLHGVGRDTLLALFARAGFAPPVVVSEQGDPDPDFPTTPFPNPEEPGALDLAFATAERIGADLVIANDPDADRLAVALPAGSAGEWRALTGDELGVVLADALLRRGSGADRLVATTIVSSTMLDRIARDHGVECARTLTGFKWIARAAEARPDLRFVFGYEEALGYAIGPYARDKDGLTAALAVAAFAARARAEHTTLLEALDGLARQHGVHATAQWSVRLEGPTGVEQMRELLAALRAAPPGELGGDAVIAVTDVLYGTRVSLAGTESIDLPTSDVLVYELESGARVLVRPSGTEPKLKCYFEVVEPVDTDGDVATARARAATRLGDLRAAFGASAGLR